jgi:hypothetical protein
MSFVIRVSADTTEVAEASKQLEEKTELISQTQIETARKLAAVGFLTVQALGGSVDQVLQVAVESVFLLAEGYRELAAAESLTGIGALNAGLKIAASIAMMKVAYDLARGRQEAAAQTRAAASAFNSLSTGVFR